MQRSASTRLVLAFLLLLGLSSLGVAQAPPQKVKNLTTAEWAETAWLRPEVIRGIEFFGDSVATDGVRVVAGAPYHEREVDDRGIVFVYERDHDLGSRIETAFLVSPFVRQEEFGDAVAIDDDTILVGAPATAPSSVYAFRHDASSGNWLFEAEIQDPEGDYGFGFDLALDGNRAVIANWVTRRAYIFERNASSGDWTYAAELEPATGRGVYYAYSVALDGNLAVVGHPDYDGPFRDSGAAHVFQLDPHGAWIEMARLESPAPVLFANFGLEVAIQGSRVLSFTGEVLGGGVYVFDRAGGQWSPSALLQPTEPTSDDAFGLSIATDKSRMAIGNPSRWPPGRVHVFEEIGGTWAATQVLTGSRVGRNEAFGAVTAVSGNVIVAGNPLEDGPVGDAYGAAYVFERDALTLAASGACPGQTTVTISKAPPNSEVAVIASGNDNGWTKGGNLCAGTVFEIGEPFQLPPLLVKTNETGSGTGIITLQNNRCWLEAMAFQGCATSGAVQVP